ncbi:MAG: hypothetical protein J7L15_03335 [Clostridiales bacterium]|nr:hypothetical protein [Clostridiales bacterium]
MTQEEMDNFKEVIHDSLLKIEDTLYLLKDGKQILANNKLLGIKQKLTFLYKDILGKM